MRWPWKKRKPVEDCLYCVFFKEDKLKNPNWDQNGGFPICAFHKAMYAPKPLTGIERHALLVVEQGRPARASAEAISEAVRCYVRDGLMGDIDIEYRPRAIVFEPGLSLVSQQQMAMQNMGMRGAYYGLGGLQQALGRIW